MDAIVPQVQTLTQGGKGLLLSNIWINKEQEIYPKDYRSRNNY
jgi:hypothetical protein